MNHLVTQTHDLARRDSRFTGLYCFVLNVRSVFLEGHPISCEERMSVLDNLPPEVRRAARFDVGEAFTRLAAYVLERIRLRVGEARITTLGEMSIVVYGWFNVFLCVVQGGGFTKGWEILKHGISQPAYGWVLAVLCSLQGFAVLFLSDRWRYNLTFAALMIHGTTAYAVYKANPTSQGLAGLGVICVLALCILFSFAYRQDVERGAADVGIP